MTLLLIFAFLAGVATILSPCILPVLPAILSAGTTKGRLRPLGITTGLVASFAFFTLTLNAIVQATGLSATVLRDIAVATLIVFGLMMVFPRLSLWFTKIISPIGNAGQHIDSSGFTGGFYFGIALGLLWTPCAGPILAVITTLVATQSVTPFAIFLTLAYSVGAGIPIFFIAYGGSKIIQTSRLLSSHAEGIRQLFGCLTILTAIAIALHWDTFLQQKIIALFPPMVIEDTSQVREEIDQQFFNLNPSKIVAKTAPGELPNLGKAADLVGLSNWINSTPLTLEQLRGKVVLIDFWTYTCINCLRTLPYITKWDADYKEHGLVIIGVHTPEFEFEKDPQNVSEAVKRLGIKYSVAQDNAYRTWSAYNNHYWPAHYLIDQAGNLRMVHFGEGAYVNTENGIRKLLGMQPLAREEPKKIHRPISPETYLGVLRGDSYTPEISLKPGQTVRYIYKTALQDDLVGLKGQWKAEDEQITAEGNDSFLDLNFLAKQVYLVLSGESKTPIAVILDGKPYDEITFDGNRKYDIVNTSYGRHQLSLKIPQGIHAYAFTFGDD